MIICPHCGRENEDHYKFCLGCGSQLPRPEAQKPAEPEAPRMINCPHCTTPVPSNFKFCGACGGPIAAAAPSATAATAPEHPAPNFGAESISGESTSSSTAQAPAASRGFVEESTSRHHAPGQLSQDSTPSIGSAVAKLVVIRPDGTEGATIPLREGEVVIGRSSSQDTLASDPFLSPQHASIVSTNGRFVIKDLDSLNGIFHRIRGEHELGSGDYIRLGQELLHFQKMEDVKALPGSSGDGETLRGGSPDIGYWGRLSLIAGPEITSRAFLFSDDEINIGREIGDIVFRDDGFVSGRHARISKVNGRVILKDLGSSNGTYIRVRGERPLEDGDLILMGQQLFRLVA
ncbi:MAG: FHA domain-containing protein [Myxococcota bacterium]|nr:FHA domain-containing protein [Myxococcota bacterium]